ncbi:hypothetical protein O3M35_003609 [Rhynocoris fuscipes]|uniref:Ankyrin repeat domain-containing protein 49 n=1 Tax=Rhynocoris fuscipes TaxID=488301 RepID=A0AAW1CLY9_9HEMI
MSDEEEEELDRLAELTELTFKAKNENVERFQVSGWDDDDLNIEHEKHPHETPAKEILWACENGEIEVVKKLLRRNIQLLEVTDNDGYTPLHRACYNGHAKLVEFLLMSGAKHDCETIDKWQPLLSACRWNQLECAALLISHGADVNATSNGGVTALHLAAGHAEAQKLLELLLCHPEIIVNLKDESGDTPYDIARRGPNEKLFEAVEPCFFDL